MNLGIGTVTSAVVIDNIPNITNNSAVTNIKGKTAEGFQNVGNTLPTQGKIIGAGLILNQTKKLRLNKFNQKSMF